MVDQDERRVFRGEGFVGSDLIRHWILLEVKPRYGLQLGLRYLVSFTFRCYNRAKQAKCQLTLRYVPLKLESMKKEALPAVRKGRPPSEMAASHAVIMDAVYALLEEKSVRDLTIEAVAKRAGVGKPTLYKWWPTKATLVLAMLVERMAPKLEKPTVLTAEQSLRFRVRSLIDAFNGPFGKIVAGLIAEGQSEPAVLQEFFDRWVSPRRNATIADLQRGKDAGELRSETEPELLNDAIFGAIYYRMLLRSGPMTRRFGEELVDQVIRGHRSGSARS
jgi:AcrR family transcriptional regulator